MVATNRMPVMVLTIKLFIFLLFLFGCRFFFFLVLIDGELLEIADNRRGKALDGHDKVVFKLYNSYAQTGKGHGTDKGLLAGLLGFKVNDKRIKDVFERADAKMYENKKFLKYI